MFRHASSEPCLCSTVSLLHHAYVPPCLYSTMSMFHRVFTPPCLCSTVSLLHHVYVPPCLFSTVSLLHHVSVPPGLYSTMSMFHRVFTPPCLCSTTDRRVLCFIMSSSHSLCSTESMNAPSQEGPSVFIGRLPARTATTISTTRVTKFGLRLALALRLGFFICVR